MPIPASRWREEVRPSKSHRKRSGIRRPRHLARPSEGTQRIAGCRPDAPGRARFSIGNVKGDRGRHGAATAGEHELVHDSYVFRMNRQSVVSDLHSVVRNLHNPENTIRRDPGIQIMYLYF